MESCFYECEVNTGFYRKYTDDQYNFCCQGWNCNTGTYNATLNYTCTGNENQWQLHAMPIKASFADSWYRACAQDYFCGDGDYFSCATDYHSEQARLAALAAERVANMTSALAGLAYIQSLQDWVIPVAVIGAILLLVLCGFTIFLICKEKSGEPVFKSAWFMTCFSRSEPSPFVITLSVFPAFPRSSRFRISRSIYRPWRRC